MDRVGMESACCAELFGRAEATPAPTVRWRIKLLKTQHAIMATIRRTCHATADFAEHGALCWSVPAVWSTGAADPAAPVAADLLARVLRLILSNHHQTSADRLMKTFENNHLSRAQRWRLTCARQFRPGQVARVCRAEG